MGHDRVLGAALTSVEYAVEVVDTQNGHALDASPSPGALASFAGTTAFGAVSDVSRQRVEHLESRYEVDSPCTAFGREFHTRCSTSP